MSPPMSDTSTTASAPLGPRPCVIAIDAGTTGVRSRAVFTDAPSVSSYREFGQHYPEPGQVEHDAVEIWERVRDTLLEVIGEVTAQGATVAAIGITNQRETVLAWSRSTGAPYGTAIVWQDRRTAGRCDELAEAGALPRVREITGLVLDPYFSGTKVEWLLANRDIPVDRRPRDRHDRLVAAVEPHGRRGARDRPVEREPHDAVRHPHARLVAGAVRPVARADERPAHGDAVERALRGHLRPLRHPGRHPRVRHRRRPAGRPVRPGLLRPGHRQEHLRHRQLRPA